MYANYGLRYRNEKLVRLLTFMLMYSGITYQRISSAEMEDFSEKEIAFEISCSWKSKNNSISVACLSWQIRSFKWNVYTLPEQETGCSRCWLLLLGRELWLPTYFRIVAESGSLVNLRWSAAFFQFMIY